MRTEINRPVTAAIPEPPFRDFSQSTDWRVLLGIVITIGWFATLAVYI